MRVKKAKSSLRLCVAYRKPAVHKKQRRKEEK